MDQQALIVGIVGGLIGWLIGMIGLRLVWAVFVPRSTYYVSPRTLHALQKSMDGAVRAAKGRD